MVLSKGPNNDLLREHCLPVQNSDSVRLCWPQIVSKMSADCNASMLLTLEKVAKLFINPMFCVNFLLKMGFIPFALRRSNLMIVVKK